MKWINARMMKRQGRLESSGASRNAKNCKRLERQFYMNDTVYYLVDPKTGDSKAVPASWNREKRRAFASQFNLFLHKKVERRVRWRVCADKIMLHDDWSPYKCFTIIPYFPYFRRGKTIGAVTFRGLRFEGRRFDCGSKVGFLEANIAYALRRDDLAGPVSQFLQEFASKHSV